MSFEKLLILSLAYKAYISKVTSAYIFHFNRFSEILRFSHKNRLHKYKNSIINCHYILSINLTLSFPFRPLNRFAASNSANIVATKKRTWQ